MSETVVKYKNPSGLPKPLGAYSHIARARASELLFIAGQLAINESGELEGFMAVRNELFARIYPGGEYPPNTLLTVDRLVGEQFLIEVEAVAAVA